MRRRHPRSTLTDTRFPDTTLFLSHLFNYDLVSGGDAILLAACAHHCEHGYVTLNKTRVPSGAWNSPRDKHPPRGKAALLCDGLESVNQNIRSEEHTSELQSLMRISYSAFCLKKKN